MTDLLILQYWSKLEIDGMFICSKNKEMQPKGIMETKTCIKGVLKLNSQILHNKEKSNCCILINCNWTPSCVGNMMFWLTTQSLHWAQFASNSEDHPLRGCSWNFFFFLSFCLKLQDAYVVPWSDLVLIASLMAMNKHVPVQWVASSHTAGRP